MSELVTAGFSGGLHADLQMVLSIGGSDVFPRFRVIAAIDWNLDKTFGEPVVTAPLTVNFTSVDINLGSVVNGFLKPIITQIDEIVDPIRPVLDFLTTDLPIIDTSPLDIARDFGYGQYAAFVEAVDWVADMAGLIAAMPGTDFWLNMGSFNVTGDSGSSQGGTITPTSTPDFKNNLSGSGADAQTKGFLDTAVSGNSSFRLNILEPATIFQLLMGNDVALLTFAVPDLAVSANYSQFFSVFGPLGMRISGDMSARLHVGFGYDTYGIRQARETGNRSYLLDGFYVTNRQNADGTGPVVPTVTFGLGLTAAAELNAGVASGGVSGGLSGRMDLTLVDPNNDGKIRMTELWYEIQAPRKLFDIHILVTASVDWYLKIGVGVLSVSYSDTIWSGTVYEDTFLAPRDAVLVKEGTDGQIVLNVGQFAGDRLNGNTADGNDTVGLIAAGNSLTVTIGGASQTVAYRPGLDSILINSGEGDDTIVIDASVHADVVVNGGAGHDVIRMAGDGNLTAEGGDGNDDWESPHDPDAKIAKMKDGRTHLAHKAEHAVDMDSQAIVAVTLQPADRGDTDSLSETVEAAVSNLLAVQIDPATAERVHAVAMEEVVADKGYHSNATMTELSAMSIRSYVSEPQRGPRHWEGQAEAREAVYANRRRIRGRRGKALLRKRGEVVERSFAHCYETGGLRRIHLRGHGNILKRLLVHVAGFNLSLVMRALLGVGKPRRLQDGLAAGLLPLLAWILAAWSWLWRQWDRSVSLWPPPASEPTPRPSA